MLVAALGEREAEAYGGAIELLAKLLTLDPLKRMSAEECRKDSYFASGSGSGGGANFGNEWFSLCERLESDIPVRKSAEDKAAEEEKAMWDNIRAMQQNQFKPPPPVPPPVPVPPMQQQQYGGQPPPQMMEDDLYNF